MPIVFSIVDFPPFGFILKPFWSIHMIYDSDSSCDHLFLMQFKGLTANAADPQAQVRDIGFMLMLMQRLICMNPLRA